MRWKLEYLLWRFNNLLWRGAVHALIVWYVKYSFKFPGGYVLTVTDAEYSVIQGRRYKTHLPCDCGATDPAICEECARPPGRLALVLEARAERNKARADLAWIRGRMKDLVATLRGMNNTVGTQAASVVELLLPESHWGPCRECGKPWRTCDPECENAEPKEPSHE